MSAMTKEEFIRRMTADQQARKKTEKAVLLKTKGEAEMEVAEAITYLIGRIDKNGKI